MSKVKSLFKKAWTSITNPGQDERVPVLVAAIDQAFREKGSAFDLDQVLEPIDCTHTDVDIASSEYYEKLLQRYWNKAVPDANRKKTLAIVADRLKLKAGDVITLNSRVAVNRFGRDLGAFLEDGVLSDEELQSLERIASFLNTTVQVLVRQYLSDESLDLLRGVFAEAALTGKLNAQTWHNLVVSAERLGVTRKELEKASGRIAKSFAERVLADTKADGILSTDEESYLAWLRSELEFDSSFDVYLGKEISMLREKTQIAEGNIVPVSVPSGVNLRAGEILYLDCDCTLSYSKDLKAGPRFYEHHGRVLLTDARVLFDSPTHSSQVPYAKIISWNASDYSMRMSVANKPELTFHATEDPSLLLRDRLTALINLSSQRLRRKVTGKVDRHIPRDIRQRVWQRYGGKCVECDAVDYLEFDHIVPVAKGGSNSEQNVQLLCRRCNQTKSDKI